MITFGELEASLAAIHDIADTKRTAFQARLKNFHRLGYPVGLKTTKGKAATYSPGQVVEMALALELTELGLPPERVVRVLTLNWYPTAMAISIAARALLERPHGFDEHEVKEGDPPSMFLFFDPAALTPLTNADVTITPDLDQAADTFFYGGEAVVKDNIVRWTSGATNRISIINVTALIDHLIGPVDSENIAAALKKKKDVLFQLSSWASAKSEDGYALEPFAEDFLFRYIETNFEPPRDGQERKRMASLLENYFGFEMKLIKKVMTDWESQQDGSRDDQHPQA